MEGHVTLAREEVPVVAVVLIRWAEGADLPEGGALFHRRGVEEDSAAAGEGKGHYGVPRNLSPSTLFNQQTLVVAYAVPPLRTPMFFFSWCNVNSGWIQIRTRACKGKVSRCTPHKNGVTIVSDWARTTTRA